MNEVTRLRKVNEKLTERMRKTEREVDRKQAIIVLAVSALEFVKNTKCEVYMGDPYDNRRFELAFYDFKRHANSILDKLKAMQGGEHG